MNDKDISFIERGLKGIIEEEGQDAVTMLFTEANTGQMHITPMTEAKSKWPLVIRFIVGKVNAKRFMLVTEAWMAKLPPDSPWVKEIQAGRMSIHELPMDDREDIVIIREQTREGKTDSVMAKVGIDRFGKRRLGKFERLPGAEVRSRFDVSWNPR